MTFKKKIVLGFLIPFSILIFSSIYLEVKISQVQNLSLEIKNTDLVLSNAANDLKYDVAEVQQWLTDISATRGANGFDDGLVKAEGYATHFKKKIEVFSQHYTKTNNQKSLEEIKKISEKFDTFYDTGKKMADLYIKGGPSAGNAFMENFDKAAAELDTLFVPFINSQIEIMNQAIEKNDQDISQAMFILKLSLGASLIISIGVGFFLFNAISTINAQFAEIGRFATLLKDGDLSAKVNIDTQDEVGRLAVSFNSTMAFIKNAFNLDQIIWSELAEQKVREVKAQEQTKSALKMAEQEKAEAMESKRFADIEKAKAQEAMIMASEEKSRAEELAANEKKSAQELRTKVNKILDVVQAASQGDLTHSINIEGSDSLGQLSKALDTFFLQLSQDLSLIDQYAQKLEKQSFTLNNKSSILNENARNTNDLSNAMSAQTQVVVSNFKDLSRSTHEMKQAVSEISKQAAETSSFSSSAVKYVEGAKIAGNKLEESSSDIHEFINVISSIARQTNLLALNATIEAARAGEAGKGFAIVAGEVKELAKQSSKAADEITHKVLTIKNNTQELSESINKVNELMGNINNASSVVASATEEQFATTDQFVSLIGISTKEADLIGSGAAKVNHSALTARDIIKENVTISMELAETSEGLNLMVKKFKLKKVESDSLKFKMVG